jgi:formylglycine-generating enzyme required for sulfatase activity
MRREAAYELVSGRFIATAPLFVASKSEPYHIDGYRFRPIDAKICVFQLTPFRLDFSMRVVAAIVLAICSLWSLTEPALAERRVALVFGNSAYQNAPLLANPTNDSAAMAAMFKGAGFNVVNLKRDLKANEMRRALRDFSDEVRDADIAIIYYAGHGLEIEGNNYLIPVDATLERDVDAYDEAISLDRVLAAVEPAKQLRLIILDACRDNPFAKTMKHTVAARSMGLSRGLSKVEPTNPNTLIAFAAKAGSTAADGDDKNSPFTTALVKYLPRPGLDLRKAFGFVRDDVLKVTHNRQEPFVYGSLGGDDVALVPGPAVQAAPAVDPYAAARTDYELALQINVPSAWDSYISKYPTGFYTDLAVAQRNKIRTAQAAAAEEAQLAVAKKSLEDAKAAQAEQARIAAVQTKVAQDARIVADNAKAAALAKAAQDKAVQDKAAQDARVAADNARAAEQARVAQAREAAEKQKALELAKAAEIKAAEVKAAEAKAAETKATELKAAEAARVKAAAQAKAEEAARLVALAKASEGERIAALVPPVGNAGHEAKSAESPSSVGCGGVSMRSLNPAPRAAKALSASEECGLKPKEAFKECENCPEMVTIPAGQVLMGSEQGDIDSGVAAANEGPQHMAVIKQAIAVGRFEITRDQYAAFVRETGYNGGDHCVTFESNQPKDRANRSFLNPGYAQGGNHPAVCVSWVNARAYVDWLSRTTGKAYRLLSEAEFEYVARAGSAARYGASNDPAELCNFANGADQSAKSAGLPPNAPYMNCKDGYPFTAPVGSFAVNGFGVYDMIGNVWEWTGDCFYGDYATARLETASRSAEVCDARSVRGGDWFSTEFSLRPAVRARADVDAHNDDIGFRVARTLAQ